MDTDSPLRLGLEGRYGKTGYRLVGHLQKDHGAGPWDEWYVEFDDGRTGWLSESEGAFHLMFEAGTEAGSSWTMLTLASACTCATAPSWWRSGGHARVVAAEGQLPSDVDPTEDRYYVDATGPKGMFVSLDFGPREQRPEVFLGQRLKLEQLGIALDQLRPRAKKVALQQARCPQCNGALELRAPDQTKRVACPFCGALLDASQGKLAFLQLLEKPELRAADSRWAPRARWTARSGSASASWCARARWRARATRGRSTCSSTTTRGFTWLMQSNGHWVYLKPIAAGDVSLVPGVAAHYEGRRYKAFQSVTAVTETVLGEFYWEVHSGEHGAGGGVRGAAVLGERGRHRQRSHLHPRRVPGALGHPGGLQAQGAAAARLRASRPASPTRTTSNPIWKWSAIWATALLALFLIVNVLRRQRGVLDMTVTLPPDAVSGQPERHALQRALPDQQARQRARGRVRRR